MVFLFRQPAIVLAEVAGDHSGISANEWHRKAIVIGLNVVFYSTVITTTINFVLGSIKREAILTGTQLDLWAHLFSPVYWLEDFEVEETGRFVEAHHPDSSAIAGGTHRRQAIIKVGGYGYPIKQLMRYFTLPWISVGKTLIFRRMPKPILIRVRRIGSVWMIDDSSAPDLQGIPFDECMTAMIDFATRFIVHADNEAVSFRFSESDFFGSTIVLEKTGREDDWILYRWKVWGVNQEDAMCGKLFCHLLPFKEPPAKIFVQARKDQANNLGVVTS